MTVWAITWLEECRFLCQIAFLSSVHNKLHSQKNQFTTNELMAPFFVTYRSRSDWGSVVKTNWPPFLSVFIYHSVICQMSDGKIYVELICRRWWWINSNITQYSPTFPVCCYEYRSNKQWQNMSSVTLISILTLWLPSLLRPTKNLAKDGVTIYSCIRNRNFSVIIQRFPDF
jgi:hypothetical protein